MLGVIINDPRAYLLLMLIALLGLIGLLLITGMIYVWRRQTRRDRLQHSETQMPDVWAESGRRLVEKMDRPPRMGMQPEDMPRRPPSEVSPEISPGGSPEAPNHPPDILGKEENDEEGPAHEKN